MLHRIIVMVAAAQGGLGVALGAFGAHALRTRLSADMLAVWQTAVLYQMFHALALLSLGALATRPTSPYLLPVAVCFAGGTWLFSGSLYLLACTPYRALGMVTPLGGVVLLLGWSLLLLAAWQNSF